MKMTIKGVRRVSFFDNEKQRQVEGVNLFVEYKDPTVVGFMLDKLFFFDSALENLGVNLPEDKYKDVLGKTAEVEYNRFGRAQSILIN